MRFEEGFPYDKDGWGPIFEINYLNEKFKSHFFFVPYYSVWLCIWTPEDDLQRLFYVGPGDRTQVVRRDARRFLSLSHLMPAYKMKEFVVLRT